MKAQPKRSRTRRGVPAADDYTKQFIDKADRFIARNARARETLDVLDVQDIAALTRRIAPSASRWLRLVRHRRRTLATYKGVAAVPNHVQRYHTLLLEEAIRDTQNAFDSIRSLTRRLEVSGLNGELSRFYVDQMMTSVEGPGRTHAIAAHFTHNETDQVGKMLTEAGLPKQDVDMLLDFGKAMPDTIGQTVLRPGDAGYPGWQGGYGPGGTGGGGGGGTGAGGGTGGGFGGLGGIEVPKGVGNFFDRGIMSLRGALTTALALELQYGMEGPYGTGVVNVGSPDTRGAFGQFGLAIGGGMSQLGAGLYIAGTVLGIASMAALGAALGLAGLLAGLLAYLLDMLIEYLEDESDEGSKGSEQPFVDP